MSDPFNGSMHGMESPPTRGFAITKSDSADLTFVTRALYVGGDGDLTVLLVGDQSAITLANVPAGAYLPIRVRRVMDATTATDIVGLV